MILYKYVSFESGIKILTDNTIGFSCLNDFNDPFESTAFGFKDRDGFLTQSVQNGAFRNNFSKKYASLSLTTNPLNPLMWAHYGASHTGLVIGFDVDDAGFNDDGFVIKAHQGTMHYFEQEPENNYLPTQNDLLNIGNDGYYSLDKSCGHLLRRAFLHKQICWEYEQEVRVVKNLNIANLISYAGKTYTHKKDLSQQEWSCIIYDFRPLYLFHFPSSAIKEIYVGEKTLVRLKRHDDDFNSRPENSLTSPRSSYSYLMNLCRKKHISIKRAQVNYTDWELKAVDLSI